ncbi:MAG TPA: 2OG-Fe(II) oxygenase, partial [Catenuloplanes sp.]
TAMQDLTGLDLTDAILKVAFYRYGPNCWFGPHRDDERKFVSHIIYCNPNWPTDAGGHLLINRTNNMDDVHSKVAPQAGTSVVVVRSDTSWHSIEPVSAQNGRCRRSLIAHFYKPGSDVNFYDR